MIKPMHSFQYILLNYKYKLVEYNFSKYDIIHGLERLLLLNLLKPIRENELEQNIMVINSQDFSSVTIVKF